MGGYNAKNVATTLYYAHSIYQPNVKNNFIFLKMVRRSVLHFMAICMYCIMYILFNFIDITPDITIKTTKEVSLHPRVLVYAIKYLYLLTTIFHG